MQLKETETEKEGEILQQKRVGVSVPLRYVFVSFVRCGRLIKYDSNGRTSSLMHLL